MPATGPARAARLGTLLAAAAAAGGRARHRRRRPRPPPRRRAGDGTVRLVVADRCRARAAAVTRAAEAAGATRTGQVPRLHSVSFEVPAAAAGPPAQPAVCPRRRDLGRRRAPAVARPTSRPTPGSPSSAPTSTAIGLPAAWDRGATGSPGVRIAIVDSGVDVRHPDLAGKVVGTYNAVTGGTDVHDVVGHGTGTASVAAAATGNGVGIAGAGRDTQPAGRQGRRRDRPDLHRRPRRRHRLGRRQRRRRRQPQPRRPDLRPAGEGRRRLRRGARRRSSSPPPATRARRPSSSRPPSPACSRSAHHVQTARRGRRSPATAPGSTWPPRAARSWSPPRAAATRWPTARRTPLRWSPARRPCSPAYRPGRTADRARRRRSSAAPTRPGSASPTACCTSTASLDLLPPAAAPTMTAPAGRRGRSAGASHGLASPAPPPGCGSASATSRRRSPPRAGSRARPSRRTASAGRSRSPPPTAAPSTSAASPTDRRRWRSTTGAPALTSPAPGQEVRGDTLAVDRRRTRGAAVRFAVDGQPRARRHRHHRALRRRPDTERLADGPHTVRADLCRERRHRLRRRPPGPARRPSRSTRLHPGISAVSPAGDQPRRRRPARPHHGHLPARPQPDADAAGAGRGRARSSTARRSARQDAGAAQRDLERAPPAGTRRRRRRRSPSQVATSDGTLQGLASRPCAVDRAAPRCARCTPVVGARAARPRRLPRHRSPSGPRLGETVRSAAARDRAPGPAPWCARVAVGSRGRPAAGANLTGTAGRAGGRLSPGTLPGAARRRGPRRQPAGSRARTVTVSAQRLVKRSGQPDGDRPRLAAARPSRTTARRSSGARAASTTAGCRYSQLLDLHLRRRVRGRRPPGAAARGGPLRHGAGVGVRRPRRPAVPRRGPGRLLRQPAEPQRATAFRLGPAVGTHRGTARQGRRRCSSGRGCCAG